MSKPDRREEVAKACPEFGALPTCTSPLHLATQRLRSLPGRGYGGQPVAEAAQKGTQNVYNTAARLCSRAQLAVTSLFEDARAGRALNTEQWASLLDEISAWLHRNPNEALRLMRTRHDASTRVVRALSVSVLMMMLAGRLEQSPAQIRQAGLAGWLHDTGSAGDLAADELSIVMQMLAVCVAYDRLTACPAEALDPAQAILRMTEWTRNGRLDTKLFAAFVECVGIYPVGSLVRLFSGRIGVVTRQSESVPYSPHVKVFYSADGAGTIPVNVVDLSHPGCGDAIVARESNAYWEFPFLDRLMAESGDSDEPLR